MEMENEKLVNKKYSPIFWRLFGLGLGISSVSAILDTMKDLPDTVVFINSLLFISTFILLFFWCKYFNESWKKIGKKYGWLIGLITIIPFGSIIALLVARHYLKNTNYWKEFEKIKKPDSLEGRKLKKKAMIIILLMILAFFIGTYSIFTFLSEQTADAITGPYTILFIVAIIGFTFYFNNKIEKLKI